MSLFNETFLNTVIVNGIIEILFHAHVLCHYWLCFYEPFTSFASQYKKPSHIWTFFFGLSFFLPFSHFFICAYLSLIGFILIYFDLAGPIFLKKTFFNFLVLLVVASFIPTWYTFFANTFFQPIKLDYTNGHNLLIMNYTKEKWMHNSSSTKTSIIYSTMMYNVALIFNYLSFYNLNSTWKDATHLIGLSFKKYVAKRNIILHSTILSICQILFLLYDWLWYVTGKKSDDKSLYYLSFKCKMFFVHVMLIVDLYSLIVSIKPLRKLMKQSLWWKKEVVIDRTKRRTINNETNI